MAHSYTRILVSGGAGFIGSHIVDRLLSEGFEVVVIDNLCTGNKENLARNQNRKDFHFIQGDVRRLDLVKDILKDVDVVFHEAAMVSVTRSVENPILTNDVNVTGTLTLLKACMDSNVRRFIFASSSSIYGETEVLPKHEGLSPHPISPYAVSKLTGENYARVFHKVYGLETVSLRYFNGYGPRQSYSQYSGVITTFMNRLLENQPPIVYGDGEQTRDFTNVQDLVDANILAIMKKNAAGEVFNIATGVPTTVNQLVQTLQEIMGKTHMKPVYRNPRPGDIRHSYADINRAKEILGYNPKVLLKEGLTDLAKWYSERS